MEQRTIEEPQTDTTNNQTTSDPSETLARSIADAAWEKKAQGLKIIDGKGIVDYADYLVICSGNTDRQVLAIADSIERSLWADFRPLGIEGKSSGNWVLMDYGDVVVHVFSEAKRDVYGLDQLWDDAQLLGVEAPPDLERPSYAQQV